MLIHSMAERLRNLGMTAMADAFLQMQTNSAAADLAREDWLGLLARSRSDRARQQAHRPKTAPGPIVWESARRIRARRGFATVKPRTSLLEENRADVPGLQCS
jgi:hypothetical protein